MKNQIEQQAIEFANNVCGTRSKKNIAQVAEWHSVKNHFKAAVEFTIKFPDVKLLSKEDETTLGWVNAWTGGNHKSMDEYMADGDPTPKAIQPKLLERLKDAIQDAKEGIQDARGDVLNDLILELKQIVNDAKEAIQPTDEDIEKEFPGNLPTQVNWARRQGAKWVRDNYMNLKPEALPQIPEDEDPLIVYDKKEASKKFADNCFPDKKDRFYWSLLQQGFVRGAEWKEGKEARPQVEQKPEVGTEPVLIKAGSNLIRLGENCSQAPKVDCRVVAEEYYQKLIKKSEVVSNIQQLIDMWKFRRSGDVSFQIPDEAFLELEILKGKL